jgi:hypothetical protein
MEVVEGRKRSATSSTTAKKRASSSKSRTKEDKEKRQSRKSARKAKGSPLKSSSEADVRDEEEEEEDLEGSEDGEKKKLKKRRSKSKKEGRAIAMPVHCESSPNLASSAPSDLGGAMPLSASGGSVMRSSADDSQIAGVHYLGGVQLVTVAQRQMRRAGKDRPRSMLFQGALLIAVEDFEGAGEHELVFQKGDVIMFIEKDDNNWVRGECNDQTGWVRAGVSQCVRVCTVVTRGIEADNRSPVSAEPRQVVAWHDVERPLQG